MSDELEKKHRIEPPNKGHPDDKVRTVVEAGLEMIPGASSVTKLVNEFYPTQARKSQDKWEAIISDRTNENTDRLDDHENIIAPTATLTGPAVDLAVALARAPGDGMRGRGQDLDALCKLMPEEERRIVEDAAFELHSHGLCEIQRAIGKHWWLYLTQRFFEQIDHQVMEWQTTTEADARHLAGLILDKNPDGRTASLLALSNWEKRRFNPAFTYLLQFISPNGISNEIQADYPTASITLLPEDRAALRRFIGR